MALSKTLCLLLVASVVCSVNAGPANVLTRASRKFLSYGYGGTNTASADAKCKARGSHWYYDQATTSCKTFTYANAGPGYSDSGSFSGSQSGHNTAYAGAQAGARGHNTHTDTKTYASTGPGGSSSGAHSKAVSYGNGYGK